MKRELTAAFVGVSVLSCSVGAASAWFVAKSRYEKLMDEEVAQVKSYYANLQEKNRKPDLEKLASKYDHAESEEPLGEDDLSEVVEILQKVDYTAAFKKEDVTKSPGIEITEPDEEIEEDKNVFEDQTGYDPDAESALKSMKKPYVITMEDYMQNAPEYDQTEITYYGGDDVLVDERDKPIDDQAYSVGVANLSKFGQGSKDKNIVYVRNDVLQLDFEIVYSDKKFAEDVLGFIEHSDEPKIRKFRRYDE